MAPVGEWRVLWNALCLNGLQKVRLSFVSPIPVSRCPRGAPAVAPEWGPVRPVSALRALRPRVEVVRSDLL